jgi:hypothetical protein
MYCKSPHLPHAVSTVSRSHPSLSWNFESISMSGLGTEKKNRVVVPTHQATHPGAIGFFGIDSWALGSLKNFRGIEVTNNEYCSRE